MREEIEHVREGKHGARSAKQAIAIGLSKARRAGVKLPPPPGKKAPKATGRKPNPRAIVGDPSGSGAARGVPQPHMKPFHARHTAARGDGAAPIGGRQR